MSCNNPIDMFGAACNPIVIGYKDVQELILTITDDETGDIIHLAGKTVTLYIYGLNDVQVQSLAGVIDDVEDEVSFTFSDIFWSKLKQSGIYTYKVKLTDGDEVKTVMASNFNIR